MEKNLSNLKFYTHIYYIHRNFTLNKLSSGFVFPDSTDYIVVDE